jgi:hypothetical protein
VIIWINAHACLASPRARLLTRLTTPFAPSGFFEPLADELFHSRADFIGFADGSAADFFMALPKGAVREARHHRR